MRIIFTPLVYLVLLTLSTNSHAGIKNFYKSSDLKKILTENINEEDLKEKLHEIELNDHISINYREARWELYTNIYLESDNQGTAFVFDVYCEKKVTNNVSDSSLPRGSQTNIEHTWPQSKFNEKFDKQVQKTDLHHLFITDSNANHMRGHQHFGEVSSFTSSNGRCKNAGLGILVKPPSNVAWSSQDFYQPPSAHRGNIARALFYFATRYQLKINDTQEYFLRKWHKEDPVEEIDIIRNDRIEAIQGNRNPFIDFPELVDKIQNF